MGTLSNLDIKDFRRFLKAQGLHYVCTNGGHEKWYKDGMMRPVIIQNHINPIPIPILKNNLNTMHCSVEQLVDFMQRK